jgi:hypothetical protein
MCLGVSSGLYARATSRLVVSDRNPAGCCLSCHPLAGVRNTVGLDWHPRTGQLWFTDAGRDGLGDNQPDDELNVLTRVGEHFGFPWCHTLGQGPPAARTLGAQALADPQLNLGGVTFTCSSKYAIRQCP